MKAVDEPLVSVPAVIDYEHGDVQAKLHDRRQFLRGDLEGAVAFEEDRASLAASAGCHSCTADALGGGSILLRKSGALSRGQHVADGKPETGCDDCGVWRQEQVSGAKEGRAVCEEENVVWAKVRVEAIIEAVLGYWGVGIGCGDGGRCLKSRRELVSAWWSFEGSSLERSFCMKDLAFMACEVVGVEMEFFRMVIVMEESGTVSQARVCVSENMGPKARTRSDDCM